MAEDIQQLIRQYRKHAADALVMSANAAPEFLTLYLRLARHWAELADLLEHGLMD